MKNINSHRIGPRMSAAAFLVSRNPGCAMLPIARAIAPHGTGIQYGYAAIHRAIRAGLIRATAGKGNSYALFAAN
jgi:hypothetical protein